MKKILYFLYLLLGLILIGSCNTGPFDVRPDKVVNKPDSTTAKDTTDDPFLEKVATVYKAKTPTLLDKNGWAIDTIAPGCIYYNFTNLDGITNARQIVDVLEVDMTSGKYKLDFAYKANADSLSSFFKSRQAAGIDVLGGVNANYELDAIYMRINSMNISEVTLDSTHLRFWKHEGAILGYKNGEVKIHLSNRKSGVRAIENYKKSTAINIIASAPSLIENYVNIGSTFCDNSLTMDQVNTLNYEDKNNHQRVRHPRTAVALTGDGDLLLITVTGRFPGHAEGMNADELTRFLIKYFNPQYALNMDGGGSTTMCVKDRGQIGTNVVNYPTDNGSFDHWGQRKREAHLLIEKVN
jgi:hypothetical protein